MGARTGASSPAQTIEAIIVRAANFSVKLHATAAVGGDAQSPAAVAV